MLISNAADAYYWQHALRPNLLGDPNGFFQTRRASAQRTEVGGWRPEVRSRIPEVGDLIIVFSHEREKKGEKRKAENYADAFFFVFRPIDVRMARSSRLSAKTSGCVVRYGSMRRQPGQ